MIKTISKQFPVIVLIEWVRETKRTIFNWGGFIFFLILIKRANPNRTNYWSLRNYFKKIHGPFWAISLRKMPRRAAAAIQESLLESTSTRTHSMVLKADTEITKLSQKK